SGLREKGPSVKNPIARHTSVDFDAESHVSINKIIPGYLAKLLSVFEGKEELAYDYKTGLWKRNNDVRTNVNNKINEELLDNNKYLKPVLDSLGQDKEDSSKLLRDIIELETEKKTGTGRFKKFSEVGNIGLDSLDKLKDKGYSEDIIDTLKNKYTEDSKKFMNSVIRSRVDLSEIFNTFSYTGTMMNVFSDKDDSNSVSTITEEYPDMIDNSNRVS